MRDYWAAGLFQTGGRAHTGNVSLSSQSKSHTVGTLENRLALYVLKCPYTNLSGFSLLSVAGKKYNNLTLCGAHTLLMATMIPD